MKMALNVYNYLDDAPAEFQDLFFNQCNRDCTHPALIEYLDTYQEVCDDLNITIVDIPDQATDYRLVSCGEVEEVYYVLNGKIYVLD